MNYVTFRIKETKDGQFVLYLHNHAQEKVYEQLRSKNLDEVVEKLKKEMEHRRHFNKLLATTPPFSDTWMSWRLNSRKPSPKSSPKTGPTPWSYMGCICRS